MGKVDCWIRDIKGKTYWIKLEFPDCSVCRFKLKEDIKQIKMLENAIDMEEALN